MKEHHLFFSLGFLMKTRHVNLARLSGISNVDSKLELNNNPLLNGIHIDEQN
jgi:hypothetical protein